jgi:hypothetical protein
MYVVSVCSYVRPPGCFFAHAIPVFLDRINRIYRIWTKHCYAVRDPFIHLQHDESPALHSSQELSGFGVRGVKFKCLGKLARGFGETFLVGEHHTIVEMRFGRFGL